MALQDTFKIDLNQIMSSEQDEWRARFIKRAKEAALVRIDKHFEDRDYHTGGGRFERVRGPGIDQIENFIVGAFIDDEGLNRFMEKFMAENFDRIMGEAMEKAIAHRCKRFAFTKVMEMQEKDFKTTKFNPADNSPETAMQMAAVMALRDNPHSGNG